MNINDSKGLALECLNRIKAHNDKLNDIVTFVEPKKEGSGLLNDVPYVIKDNCSTKGIKTTACCNLLNNYVPVFDSTVYKKLKEAGAILIGKASMDELAMGGTNKYSNVGPCHNPYDLNRISGGSSGGSAVAVASGDVPFSIGSDTGDSIRKPASYCGVVGVKPTYGRISRYGVIPYASSLDHVGYFTENVKDAALLLEVLSGRDDNDLTSSNEKVLEYSKLLNSDVKGKKILIFGNVVDSITNKDILNSFNNVVDSLKKNGAIIEEVSFNEDLMKAIFPAYYIISNAEATANHSNLSGVLFGDTKEGESVDEIMFNTRTSGFNSYVKKRFVIGSYALKADNQEKVFRKAQKIRRLIVDEIMSKLKDADALIAPAASDVAPLINENASGAQLTNTYLIADNYMAIANFAGLPSITVPMGFSSNMPIGLNITCNLFKEDIMFNISKAIEDIVDIKDKCKEDF